MTSPNLAPDGGGHADDDTALQKLELQYELICGLRKLRGAPPIAREAFFSAHYGPVQPQPKHKMVLVPEQENPKMELADVRHDHAKRRHVRKIVRVRSLRLPPLMTAHKRLTDPHDPTYTAMTFAHARRLAFFDKVCDSPDECDVMALMANMPRNKLLGLHHRGSVSPSRHRK